MTSIFGSFFSEQATLSVRKSHDFSTQMVDFGVDFGGFYVGFWCLWGVFWFFFGVLLMFSSVLQSAFCGFKVFFIVFCWCFVWLLSGCHECESLVVLSCL